MWSVNRQRIQMVEDDFGIQLPCTIEGITFASADEIRLVIKDSLNGTLILEKTYTNIQQNTITIELTEEESALLPVGEYAYSLDWYQNGNFMCNIVPVDSFSVVEKA